MFVCKYCGLEVSAPNHPRWCNSNPNLELNKKLASDKTKEYSSEMLKQCWADGRRSSEKTKWNPKRAKHTEETKEIIRKKALDSKHRRLVRSIRNYVCKDGSIVKLDSSWEEKLARRLDDLNILWERPDCLDWVDSTGKVRHYFPDFYLPEYWVYLDPKNPAAMKQQVEKVNWLKQNRKDVIFLVSETECETFDPIQLTHNQS